MASSSSSTSSFLLASSSCPIEISVDQDLAVLPTTLMPRARGECCRKFGYEILVGKLRLENDCNNRHVVVPVDNSTVSDDHIAAADDFTGSYDSAIDLDDASWDSEFVSQRNSVRGI